ncbi:DUF7089 family protein [Halobaculum magnesiiphilum]|uniref:Uncharacterized protein n=1 Tax=Halobaculum magnesiiphilum TaxID=1017351 RepID=A0A8T8W994_9EURY|nr:hypothetical protein [Halobaculum magnesiiphilum]QZP36432.1 hypothetical protein K6T50_08805 [Halobaculum magnesiiphilum]
MAGFERRTLTPPVEAVREAYAPDSVVLDAGADFETLPPEAAEELGLLVDALDPAAYPREWLPDDAPAQLRRYAGSDFTIGMPGDGTVVWTRQTTPPTVIAKKRAEGTPEDFLAFLLSEAFVELSLEVPEHFLPFFGESYRDLAAATPLGPNETYQLAAALFDAWVGIQSREEFSGWAADAGGNGDTGTDGNADAAADADAGATAHPEIHAAWADAGDRLVDRLENLPAEVAHGDLSFTAATEYACAAVKHDLDLPAPFSALDTAAYRDHGADYAVRWAEKTFEKLGE